MSRALSSGRAFSTLFLFLMVATATLLQGQAKPASQKAAPPAAEGSAPVTTLRVTTRMVTLQIVVRNSKGGAVSGLTPDDFQVFEQVPPKKEQRRQRIAAFQEVSVAAIAAADKGSVQMPAGVYSNLVTMQKMPVPPTILLVDGLNSSIAAQMQVRRQMVKLLASIPLDIPVAVFLLDRNLHLLQNFTTDRTLLRAAVQRTITASGSELSPADVRSDASALATLVQDNPPPTPPAPPAGGAGGASPELQQRQSAVTEQVQWLQQFERETFTMQTTIRVQTTLAALRTIARHVSGYPGRKNLLWISSSFPLAIFPDSDFKFAGMEEYQDRFAALANILSDAKIAVYPMDPAGLESQGFYDASARPSNRTVAIGTVTSATTMREESVRSSNQQTMTQLAEQTGGRVCVNNNDLSDCVKKAVDDGSSYYELAYYPDAGNWTGEFHRVSVKATQGFHLAFREGYYARPQGSSEPEKDSSKQNELQDATCHDLLTSTSILLMTQSIPADQPGEAKFFIAVDPRLVSFVPNAGGRTLSMIVAACTFAKSGNSLQYLQQPTDLTVNDKDYTALMAQHAFTRTLNFTPNPNTVRVRLLVRDNASGRMGSVDLPFPSAPAAATSPAPPALDKVEPAPPK